MTTSEREFIELETGWGVIQKAITKLKNILAGISDQQFTSEEYIMFYTTVYKMCTQKPPHDYSRQLYLRYRETFIEYLASVVLPVLREKHDEFILRELVKRWQNHKIMVRWLSRIFNYLDRGFTAKNSLPGLDEVGCRCFHDLVYQEIKNNVRGAVINLIDREREGEQIDRALLKNVLSIFVEIRMGNMDAYEIDFESAMLEDTASYYSRKAASWISEDSWSDYMLKTEECLKRERERVAHYLHSSSEQKLLEKVRNELLSQYESQLLDKEHPGCHALLRDDKYVTGEGTSFVKHAEDAASNKKGEKKDVVGAQEQVCSTLEEFDAEDFGSGRVQRQEFRRRLEGIHEGEMQREHDEGIHEEAMHGEHHEGAIEGEHHGGTYDSDESTRMLIECIFQQDSL